MLQILVKKHLWIAAVSDKYFKVSADDVPEAIFFDKGDNVTVTFKTSDGAWADATGITAAEEESVA